MPPNAAGGSQGTPRINISGKERDVFCRWMLSVCRNAVKDMAHTVKTALSPHSGEKHKRSS